MAICRVCKQEIDKSKDDWIMPSKNYYFHKTCYGKFKEGKEIKNDSDYEPLIFDYISRDLKVSYDYYKIHAQIQNFLKDGMTCKGILFTLKYYYDKYGKSNWERGYGGIGIVPYCYKEATEYWTNIEMRQRGSCDKVVEQIKSLNKEYEPIKYNPIKPKKKKKLIDLNSIEEVELDN